MSRVYSMPTPGKLMRKTLSEGKDEEDFPLEERTLSESRLERELNDSRRRIIFADISEDDKRKGLHHDNVRRGIQSFYSETRIAKESRKRIGTDVNDRNASLMKRALEYEKELPSLTETSFPERKKTEFYVDDFPIIELEKRIDEAFLTANNIDDSTHEEMNSLHSLTLNYILNNINSLNSKDPKERNGGISNLLSDVRTRLNDIMPGARGRKNPGINDIDSIKRTKNDIASNLLAQYINEEKPDHERLTDDMRRLEKEFNVSIISEDATAEENLRRVIEHVEDENQKEMLGKLKERIDRRNKYNDRVSELASYETFDVMFERIRSSIIDNIENRISHADLKEKKSSMLDNFKSNLYSALDSDEFNDIMRRALHEDEESICNIVNDIGDVGRNVKSYARSVRYKKVKKNLSDSIGRLYESLEMKDPHQLEDTIERLACTAKENPEKFKRFGILKDLLRITFNGYHDFDSNKQAFSDFRKRHREDSEGNKESVRSSLLGKAQETRYIDSMNYEMMKVQGCPDERLGFYVRKSLGNLIYEEKDVIARSTMDDKYKQDITQASKRLLKAIYDSTDSSDIETVMRSLKDTLSKEDSTDPDFATDLFKSRMVLAANYIREKGTDFSKSELTEYAREIRDRYERRDMRKEDAA